MIQDTDDLRIQSLQPLLSPAILQQEIAMTEKASETVAQARKERRRLSVAKTIDASSLLVPARFMTPRRPENMRHLIEARHQYKEDLCILMRVYFEKPEPP